MGRDPFAWGRLATCLGSSGNLPGFAWFILVGFVQFLFSIYLVLKYFELSRKKKERNKRLDLVLVVFFLLVIFKNFVKIKNNL